MRLSAFVLVALLAPAWAADDPFADRIAALDWSDCADDGGWECPFAHDLKRLDEFSDQRKRYDRFAAKLGDWAPGKVEDVPQRVRNLVALASLADIDQDSLEAEVPLLVLERLQASIAKGPLIAALAAVVLDGKAGTVVTAAADLDLAAAVPEKDIRERSALYAKKMLGRVLGKLPAKSP